MRLTLEEIAGALDARGKFDGAREVVGYSIDSRTVAAGELFFAIRGERLDAHEFARAAMAKGAAGAVVARERASEFTDVRSVMVVEDPLAALQRLGNFVRRRWGKRLIGLTGSAGKTTTKDAIAEVLATKSQVLKSEGNLNNHIGLPLQLLKLEPEHETAVIEMGMNHAGEIAELCRIAEPDWAVVTNAGTAHAGNFADGVAGVARAKKELVEGTRRGGVVVLNADDERVREFGKEYDGRVLLFGTSATAEVRAENVEERGGLGTEFDCVHAGERVRARLPLIGRHNLMNALAAIAVGIATEIPLETCAAAVEKLKAGDKRGEVLRVVTADGGTATLINDCYNSNPKALDAMVEALKRVPAGRRIVVAGEMLELGELATEAHRECGRFIARSGIEYTLGVRGAAQQLIEGVLEAGGAGEFVETPRQAGEWLRRNLREGDAALLKASRGVRLEGALTEFERRG